MALSKAAEEETALVGIESAPLAADAEEAHQVRRRIGGAMALSKAAEEETALVGIESAPLAADAEEAEPTEEAEKKPTEEAEKIRWRILEAEKIRWWIRLLHWASLMGRRERTGFFDRYPAQETGFFSELASTDGLLEVDTRAPLLGEEGQGGGSSQGSTLSQFLSYNYCFTRIDIIAAAAAKKDKEVARRLRATKAPAVSVITSCDGREEGMKLARHDLLPTMPALLPRSSGGWLSASIFSCTDPGPIPVGEPLDVRQLTRHEEERLRAMKPGHFKKLTMDVRLVMDCLRHYNSMHMGDEYESAPGKVTRHCHMRNGICWTHGNFMARRKRSGFFSFLPAPRTLFFFELAFKDGFDQVVTCTPLSDEPVTEAYSVLGFPLWWSTRRNGRLDCICKTCNRRLEVLHPDLKRTFACGHKEVERVCEMCYHCSDALHPSPGEFAFGNSNSH